MKQSQEYEVVISGIAGQFPECEDVDELWTKLIAGDEDMVTIDNRRWPPGTLGVPGGTGKLKEPNFFDLTFFGVSRRLCLDMDVLMKLCLEQSYRAICDAGVNPSELSGSNGAVLMSSVTSETEYECVVRSQSLGQAMLGHSRAMQANRISYFLNLKGPSLMIDSSWCGGVQGLQYAHDLISTGEVTSALVGACSVLSCPPVSFHYQAMGKLSQDCKTRSFSADANGYARSEGCAVFFLQRRDQARRSYGSVLSVLMESFGSRITPYSELSLVDFKRMLLKAYKRAKVSPKDLTFLEASGTASKEKDARELMAVADVILPARDKPLLVGSIKSNMGHCEGAASMMGPVKLALILDRGFIPPNIHYDSPNPLIPAFVSGKMEVVTKPTPLEGNLVACTEFGIGGDFSHMIVKRHDKAKKNRCKIGELPSDGLPRLVLMSDRSENNLLANRKRLYQMPIDEEFVCLMNHVYKDGIKNHLYRGYTVLNGEENNYMQTDQYKDEGSRRPVWFMFSGMGSQWPTMGKTLMKLPVFARAIQKCHDTLAPKGVSVLDILTKDDPTMFDTILNSFVGIAAVQIGLADVLKEVGIVPDGIVGHSVGELGCAYADGCFTAEQMILSAYARGRASVETSLIPGMMAAVGKGYNEIKNQLPETIEVACHNSNTSCTLSGPKEDMEKYTAKLKKDGVFAKLVNVANIAYHSRYIKPAAPALLKYLKDVIPEPKPRSSKWISSSIPESEWAKDLAQTSSPEYHTNNLLSSVLFEEASAHIPANAIVIEIAPHGLLQAIVKRSIPTASHIPLTSRFDADNLMHLLGAIGKIYMQGIPVDIQKLYPPIEFPVSRETPAISPFVGWQHTEEFKVIYFNELYNQKSVGWKEFKVFLTEETYSSLRFHRIKERIVIPPSFYIGSVLELFSDLRPKALESTIAIENFDCIKEVEILHSTVDILAELQRGAGNFCFFHGGKLASKGRILSLEKYPLGQIDEKDLNGDCFSGKEVTSYLNSMGLSLSGRFAAIKTLSIKDHLVRAIIKWNGSVTEFLNNVFTLVGFYDSKKENELRIVTRAVNITIDFPVLTKSNEVYVEYNAITNIIRSDCVQVLIPTTSRPVLSSVQTKDLDYSIETFEFVPFINSELTSVDQIMSVCSQLVIENLPFQTQEKAYTVRVFSVGKDVSFYQSLDTLSQAMKGSCALQVSLASDEEEFYKQDMSFIHQEIVWFISMRKPSDKMLKSLTSSLHGFILMPKDGGQATINVIMEFMFKGVNYVLGSALPKQQDRAYAIVDANEKYLDLLKDKLEKAAKDNWKNDQDRNLVILAGKLESITSTIAIIEEAERLPHKNLIRYVFTDQDCPRSILNDVNYKSQIVKNLKLNIYKGGVWGSLRLLPASLKQRPSTKDEIGKDKFIFPLNSMISTSDIVAVGVNLTDVTRTLPNDSLGLFDYVTPTTVGLAEYNANINTFVPHKILKWERPKSWTDSEAATVPLLYSLAALIVYYKDNALRLNAYPDADNEKSSILVTNGVLPLSQAIITLALHEHLEVFVTVESEEEKAELLGLFPKLKIQNILDHSGNDFHVHIRKLKGKHGVAKVVCTLNENDKVDSCIKSLDFEFGTVILVSQAPMDGRTNIGLFIFLSEAVITGVTPDTLMNSSDQEKLELQKKVQTLIRSGVIKPFKTYTTLPPNTLNVNAVEHLKAAKSKIVVSFKNNVCQNAANTKFICDRNKSYVIICGQHQLDLWLDLADWLLKRDARKLTVFLTQTTLSTLTNMRYQSLTKQYFGAKINLHSMKHISSKLAMCRFFEDLEYREGIDTIFFIGTDLRGKIQDIDTALEQQKSKCRIVCLGHGGEIVCYRRNARGLSSLCVRCSSDELSSPDVLRYLEQLIIEAAHRPVVLLTENYLSSNVKNFKSGKSQYVPETLPELTELLRLSGGQPRFTSVATHTSRLPHAKEVNPVFIIPGLRPHQTSKLCEKLYYPALEARLPEDCLNIDNVASQLVEQMISYSVNRFTIVADGWGGILALLIGARLESLDKFVKVILLDGAPQSTMKTASDLLKDETDFIDKYLKLSPKAESAVRSRGVWKDKLNAAVASSNLDEQEGIIAAESISFLRNRLLAILSSKPPQNKIKTKCHLIQYDSELRGSGQSGLDNYLTEEHVVHLKGGHTIVENMTLSAEDVNRLVMFEYRDAANPPMENRVNVQDICADAFGS